MSDETKPLTDPFAGSDKTEADAEKESYIVKVLGGRADAGPGSESQQLGDDVFADLQAAGEVLQPLYDPMVWSFLLEQNTRLKKLVESMAHNTVGLGYEIVPRKEEESFVEENEEDIKAEREKFAELFDSINPEMPFSEVMYQIKTDEEATGAGYMEVVRAKAESGEYGRLVKELWHIPSHTMRVAKPTKGRSRFIQMRIPGDNTKKVYFKGFGEEHELNKLTGKWDDEAGADITTANRATEVVQFKLYTPRSTFYGVPRVVSAAPAVAGNRLAARRNVAFFENDATPRLAVVVHGGELSPESMKMIEEFIDARGKGPGNAGRLMILQGQGADNMMSEASQVKIELIPLTVGVQDDASFVRYTTSNNEEIREAFGIGQIFIGTSDDVNRAVALAMKQLTVEQVFEPQSRRYEYRINQTVLRTNGAKVTKLRFQRPRTEDLMVEAQAISVLSAAGGITPNDIRAHRNKPKLQGKYADTPISILKLGLLEDPDNEIATLLSEYGDNLIPPEPEGGDTGGGKRQHRMETEIVSEEQLLEMFGAENAPAIHEEVQSIAHKLTEMGFEVGIAPALNALGKDTE